ARGLGRPAAGPLCRFGLRRAGRDAGAKVATEQRNVLKRARRMGSANEGRTGAGFFRSSLRQKYFLESTFAGARFCWRIWSPPVRSDVLRKKRMKHAVAGVA